MCFCYELDCYAYNLVTSAFYTFAAQEPYWRCVYYCIAATAICRSIRNVQSGVEQKDCAAVACTEDSRTLLLPVLYMRITILLLVQTVSGQNPVTIWQCRSNIILYYKHIIISIIQTL